MVHWFIASSGVVHWMVHWILDWFIIFFFFLTSARAKPRYFSSEHPHPWAPAPAPPEAMLLRQCCGIVRGHCPTHNDPLENPMNHPSPARDSKSVPKSCFPSFSGHFWDTFGTLLGHFCNIFGIRLGHVSETFSTLFAQFWHTFGVCWYTFSPLHDDTTLLVSPRTTLF